MKKMIMMVAMVFSLSTMYAFTGEEAVSKQAVNNFQSQFKGATETNWTIGKNYYKVAFNLGDQKLFAYYNTEGDFIAVTRYISSVQLPLTLQTGLKNDYSNYWISDLFEMADKDGTSYYVTLEDADAKIVLQSTDGKNWYSYSKSKKA